MSQRVTYKLSRTKLFSSWLFKDYGDVVCVVCENCKCECPKTEFNINLLSPYCPICGAKMVSCELGGNQVNED